MGQPPESMLMMLASNGKIREYYGGYR